jgi:C-methyltransferase C-terminal domain/Methyltransferase domain/Putative zinc binding domain
MNIGSPVKKLAAGTGGSVVVEKCQSCDSDDLTSLIFVGYLPPVNTMPAIGSRSAEQPAYPAELLLCRVCQLVQLGLIVDPAILFPPTYPYTSGSTRILRDNFAELAAQVAALFPMEPDDLIIDIGSNDGTLLSNFVGRHRVLGIEPTDAGALARGRGIPTLTSFFNRDLARSVVAREGKATVVTAANVFAHIEDVHSVVDGVLEMLVDSGLFITESHYLLSLIETMQYDTIYHEHLRYYSLQSLKHLLEMHGLEVIDARRIATHGGSIRVYAARKGQRPVRPEVADLLSLEREALTETRLKGFRDHVVLTKMGLHALLKPIKERGERIYAIGAPSRASTLINYAGLDDAILDCVLEIAGSYKIGKYIPGTLIPVLDESKLFDDQPEYALLLSWHIALELIPKLRSRGFRGKFLVPLPEPRIVED